MGRRALAIRHCSTGSMRSRRRRSSARREEYREGRSTELFGKRGSYSGKQHSGKQPLRQRRPKLKKEQRTRAVAKGGQQTSKCENGCCARHDRASELSLRSGHG